LRAAECERLGQGLYRTGLLAAGRQRQRLKRPDLDDAARAVLAFCGRAQPVQQAQRRAGPALGEQHPRQQQVFLFALVCRLVAGVKAALFRPAGGRGEVAVGQ
jgi:hypothetical protein